MKKPYLALVEAASFDALFLHPTLVTPSPAIQVAPLRTNQFIKLKHLKETDTNLTISDIYFTVTFMVDKKETITVGRYSANVEFGVIPIFNNSNRQAISSVIRIREVPVILDTDVPLLAEYLSRFETTSLEYISINAFFNVDTNVVGVQATFLTEIPGFEIVGYDLAYNDGSIELVATA